MKLSCMDIEYGIGIIGWKTTQLSTTLKVIQGFVKESASVLCSTCGLALSVNRILGYEFKLERHSVEHIPSPKVPLINLAASNCTHSYILLPLYAWYFSSWAMYYSLGNWWKCQKTSCFVLSQRKWEKKFWDPPQIYWVLSWPMSHASTNFSGILQCSSCTILLKNKHNLLVGRTYDCTSCGETNEWEREIAW